MPTTWHWLNWLSPTSTSSPRGPQNLCVVHVLKNGQGVSEIKAVFDIINGEQDTNIMFAEAIIDEAKSLSFMQKNT